MFSPMTKISLSVLQKALNGWYICLVGFMGEKLDILHWDILKSSFSAEGEK